MGRCFLDLVDGDVRRDEVGQELPDREAIRAAASARLSSHLSTKRPPLWEGGTIEVRVRDENETVVLVLRLEMD